MKIKSFSLKMMTFSFLLFSYMNSYAKPVLDETHPTARVARLVEKLAVADSEQSEITLSKIDAIRREYPENTDVLLMYINGLVSERHYKKSIYFLGVLYKKKPIRTYLITQCMLKERLGDKDRKCYENVVNLSEKDKLIDSDYITALFFTDEEKFNTIKNQWLKENKLQEDDLLIFKSGREQMLQQLFP